MRSGGAPNAFGIRGTGLTARRAGEKVDVIGAGQHGGLGACEQAPFLMAAGPGFARGITRTEPASVLDIAPTILAHRGIAAAGLDGRQLQSA